MKVVYCGIDDAGLEIVKACMTEYSAGVTFDELSSAGIAAKLKMQLKKPDLVLCILGQSVVAASAGKLKLVLDNPKVCVYESVEQLKNYFKEMYNITVDVSVPEPVKEPEIKQSVNEDFFEQKEDVQAQVNEDFELEKRKLKGTINMLEETNKELLSKLEALSDSTQSVNVAEYEGKIGTLEREITEKDAEITQLREKEEQYGKTREELGVLKETFEKIRTEYSALESEKQGMEQSIADLKELNESLEASKTKYKKRLEQSAMMEVDFAKMQNDITEAQEQRDALDAQVKELTEELVGVKAEAEKTGVLNQEIEELKATLDERQSKIEELGSELEEISELENDITERDSKLQDAGVKISNLEEKVSDLESQVADYNEKYVSLIKEKEIIENKLELSEQTSTAKGDKLNEELAESKAEVTKLTEGLSLSKEEVKRQKEEIMRITIEHDKKVAEVTEVKAELEAVQLELTTTKDKLDTVSSVDTENKEKVKRLKDEKSVLESKINDTETKLQQTIKELSGVKQIAERKQAKIDELLGKLQDAGNSDVEVALRQELLKAKDIIKEKNEDLVSMDEMLAEIQEDVFVEASNAALPKVANNIRIPVTDHVLQNVKLCVAGSGESGLTVYRTLFREMEQNTNKRYLFVDLVNESYVDYVFGAKNIPNPLGWLEGRESIKTSVTNSKLKHVKVMSFGLNYMNDNYYLKVDWKSRLEELNKLGFTVVLYVGCIDCLVRNILYNSFSGVCRSYVITKASPTNLRAALLHLNSFVEVKNTTVVCAEYAESSAKMYGKVAEKYNTLILDEKTMIGI